jgi:uncharacterized membrane protein YdbT with pleckstrin-like domain
VLVNVTNSAKDKHDRDKDMKRYLKLNKKMFVGILIFCITVIFLILLKFYLDIFILLILGNGFLLYEKYKKGGFFWKNIYHDDSADNPSVIKKEKE